MPSGTITAEVFEAFLRCPTKAQLYLRGGVGVPQEFCEWERQRCEQFKHAAAECLLRGVPERERHIGMPSPEEWESQRYRVILDCTVEGAGISASLDALVLDANRCRGTHPYLPVRFVVNDKIKRIDKLLVAFDALVLLRSSGMMPRAGKIIYGRKGVTISLQLPLLVAEVTRLLPRIDALASSKPDVILNPHCQECEFEDQCRTTALAQDDLSLLARMTTRERTKLHQKGIFTVTQLSYTFRPRRRPTARPPKRDHALQALAIRKQQIHTQGTPDLGNSATNVYLDVEGVPERNFYYLIGLRYYNGAAVVRESFWADGEAGERAMWASCLRSLSHLEQPRLVHYGSYETHFLKEMRARYSDLLEYTPLVDRLAASAVNLLSQIYARVYFPTYLNTLKEIATYLGFSWSEIAPSGRTALLWRYQWESSQNPELKCRLIRYNAEDCEAAERVMTALVQLAKPPSRVQQTAVDVALLKREYPQHFGNTPFALPVFEQINAAAQWDYQRHKIYARIHKPSARRLDSRLTSQSRRIAPVNKTMDAAETRPLCCEKCGGTLIYRYGTYAQVVYDLKISPGGMKRWTVRYLYHRYICWQCRATCIPYARQPKYGAQLAAYTLYQVIELRSAQNAVVNHLRECFGLNLSRGVVNHLKAAVAQRYQGTYDAILDRLIAGRLVHADETKVSINGQDTYVWAFTNREDVAYVYSDSRETTTPQKVLQNFQGVLVSDFYTGYDSLPCAQQKCLIHLLRDINDDVYKYPFDSDMQDIARAFANVLQPIIQTIDRFGLKTYHLRKHRAAVDQFCDTVSSREYESEVARAYRKRVEKYRHSLFTFLQHDGVPWNNNNAEHAIKSFVYLRNVIGGTSSEKGIRNYLVLLSISETCKYRGISFLRFLQSQTTDLPAFAETLHGRTGPLDARRR